MDEMTSSGFSQKEMLERILSKLDRVEERLTETHELALQTNGKVKMHTKIIFAFGGAFLTALGWLLSAFLRHIVNGG